MMLKVDVKEKARTRDLRVLKKWNEEDTFRRSMENRKGRPNYVFYEGRRRRTALRTSGTFSAASSKTLSAATKR